MNGILTKYSVCIRRQSFTSCTTKVTVPFTQTSYTFTGLKPYVQYTIEISAGTKVGYGPRAKITQRTRESGKRRMYNIYEHETFMDEWIVIMFIKLMILIELVI